MAVRFLQGDKLPNGKPGQRIGKWLAMRWTGGHFVDDMLELKKVLETNCPDGPQGHLICLSIGDHGDAPHPTMEVRKRIEGEFKSLLPYFQEVCLVVLSEGFKASLEYTMFSMVATAMNVGKKGGYVRTERSVPAALGRLEAAKGTDQDFPRFVTASMNAKVITADEFSIWMRSRVK